MTNGWCGGGCHQCMMVKDAVADMSDKVALTQIYAHEKTEMRRYGESLDVVYVVYVDGESFRPDGPPVTMKEFRQTLLDRYAKKP